MVSYDLPALFLAHFDCLQGEPVFSMSCAFQGVGFCSSISQASAPQPSIATVAFAVGVAVALWRSLSLRRCCHLAGHVMSHQTCRSSCCSSNRRTLGKAALAAQECGGLRKGEGFQKILLHRSFAMGPFLSRDI